ncbi:MAG: dihydrolipoamide acetyltransferase family protein, partial [Candidatus Promineifilaceae bacterium]
FDMEEGTMGVWLKDGDTVAIGDVLAEIESDKVTQELTARAEGVLLAIFANEGDIIPVGSNLGAIGAAGEDVSGLGSGVAASEEATEEVAPVEEAAPIAAAASTGAAPEAISDEFPGGVKATPVARRIAAEKGINLAHVKGSGPGGRVRKADVEAHNETGSGSAPAAANLAASTAQAAPVYAPVAIPAGPEQSEAGLTRLRKAIARRMTESKQTVPHFQVTSAVDMTDALALRKQINGALPEGEKVSVNDMIVKACGVALRKYPNINASWGGDKLIINNRVNVGTAVAVEGGLLTVVQHNTDVSSLRQVAAENRAKIGRARAGKVQLEDIQGSTFSVSNLGAYDVFEFIAIINPPEAAILAVGSANQEAVVRNGEIVIRNIMRVTISADHRVTDGAEAAQFLQHLKSILETPLKLML